MKHKALLEMIPKSAQDRIALTFFICGIPFAIWFEFFIVLPTYEVSWEAYLAVGIYLAIQVYWNLYYMLRVSTTVASIDEDPTSYPYVIVCDKCGKSPPRSHHCKACDICILKRDHHCWFAGCCAGYSNHRYYLMVIFHALIGGLYANYFHLSFVIKTLGVSGRTLVSMIAPHFLWVCGFYTNYEFFIAAVFDIAVYFSGLLLWLMCRQVIQIIQGQTAFERSSNCRTFDKGLLKNIEEVLGERWYLVWIAPVINSKLPPIKSHWESKDKDL